MSEFCAMHLRLMKTIGRLLVLALLSLTIGVLAATETNWPMEAFDPDETDMESLQRGANLYVNFCLGCHSLEYQRYERLATDLGPIDPELVEQLLIQTDQKIGEHMQSSMSKEDAKKWFGAPPPDLTMVTRVRSPEWVYNFLNSFYVDESRPFGVNNKVFPNVGMPHALLSLQGITNEVCDGLVSVDVMGGLNAIDAPREENCYKLETVSGTGLYDEKAFVQATADITNFLHYVADPTRQERVALGAPVIGFLFVLLILAYFLNRNYWQDIKREEQ